jgi:hypothetical protein
MRKWINLFENQQQWPETIEGTALADLAQDWHHSPEDFDEGDIYQNITDFGTYHLRTIPLSDLKMGRFTIHDELVDDYSARTTSAPPIIVDARHGIIIDGNHRAEAALKRRERNILAYVGDPATYDPSPDEDEDDDEDDDEWHPQEEF